MVTVMARTPIWKTIQTTLTNEIADGHYRPGDKLPTEAALSTRFGVNRHTVRRALAEMSDKGVTHARRGAGVFVAARPTDYPIGRRVRFHQNLRAAGQSPQRRILRLETRVADARECEELNLNTGSQVHVYEAVSMSDGAPIVLARSVFPADRLPDLPTQLRRTKSVTRALKACGVTDYTRATTRLTAKLADSTHALHLQIQEGAPILRSVSVNIDAEGTPVEFGHSWFAGDRITLVVTPEDA